MLRKLFYRLLSLFAPPKPTLAISKRAQRRLAHTSLIYEGPMRCRDGRARQVRWLRLNMAYTNRNKYA